MMLQKLAELCSLSQTIPTVVSGAVVVKVWGPPAWVAVRSGQLSAEGWFVLGVASGFIGAVLDNLYWSLPWTASFLELESTDALMANGVYFNIVSRQSLGTFAAYCHLKAAEEHDSLRAGAANAILAYSHVAAVIAAALLIASA